MPTALILKDLIVKLGISVSEFERKLDVGNTSILKAIDRNSDIKAGTIAKIIEVFPNVSEIWLKTGKGDMFVSGHAKEGRAKASILLNLIEELDTNINAFEKAIGTGVGTISKAIVRESKITLDIVRKIKTAYPQVNEAWLETGEGDMFDMSQIGAKASGGKEVIPLGKHLPVRGDNGNWGGLPMYNVAITATFVQSYRDESFYTPQYYLYDPRFKDCDFGAVITGDSMHAEIRHGDYVACKEVTDWKFVVFGDIYYVVATNGLETCKYLNADPHDQSNFLLVPRNDSISPSPIPKEMILKLYRVRGIVRGY